MKSCHENKQKYKSKQRQLACFYAYIQALRLFVLLKSSDTQVSKTPKLKHYCYARYDEQTKKSLWGTKTTTRYVVSHVRV